MWLIYFFIYAIFLNSCNGADEGNETDSDTSRKILGSSVVTSVSVVMDTGNGKKTVYTDAVGKPQSKPSNPSELASPIDLLNPDRYEFYTFDDNGNLVKRLMSLDEIKSIIATGDSDAFDLDSFTSQGFLPEKRVSDIVNNVQSVLKEEMEILKDPISKPIFDTPDVSDSWSMILPAVFGNSGQDIKPEKPIVHITPDTIMLEPNMPMYHTTSPPQKVNFILSSSTTIKNRPHSPSTHRPSSIPTPSSTYLSQPIYYSGHSLPTTQKLSSTTEPSINVEIFSNSMSTTDSNLSNESFVLEEMPAAKNEPLPTRAPTLFLTRPPLIRNITDTSNLNSTLTVVQFTTSTASTSSSAQSDVGSHPSNITIASFKPTTTQSTTTNNKPIIQNENTLPVVTSQFSKTSFIPTASPLTSTEESSISTVSPGSSNFTSVVPSTGYVPTATLLTSSTFKMPTKNTSLVTATTSRLTVEPQLSSSSTVSNFYSTIPNINISATDVTTAHITSAVPLTVLKTSDMINIPDFNTEGSISASSSQNPILALSSSIQQPSWTPSHKDAELFNIFKETIAKGTTTENIKNERPTSVTNDENSSSDTALKDTTTSIWNKIQLSKNSESNDDDLATLPTEYLDQKLTTGINQDNIDPTTQLPPLLNSLSDNQKISASELLDQLLLTTNIYEINTELASPKINISEMDVRFGNTESNLLPTTNQDSDQQTTTTDHDVISYPPTTDITLMQSIEQLLSQAVGDISSAFNQTIEISKVQEMVENTLTKNMTDFIKESATIGSEITVNEQKPQTTQEFIYTTEKNPSETISTNTNNDNLSSSVDALLSQVYQNTASLNNVMVTEKNNVGVTYRRVDDENETTVSVKATTQKYATDLELSTRTINENTTQNLTTEHKEAEQEATTYYYIVKKDPNSSIIKNESSHIINITILGLEPIKNRTKPAKADFSLEQELIAEEMKNMSSFVNSTLQNPLQLNDNLQQSETNIIVINSTSNIKNVNNEDSERTKLNNPTTPYLNNVGDVITTSEQNQASEEYISTSAETETTTNNLLFTEASTIEITTINVQEEKMTSQATTEYIQKTKRPPKPSIIITVNKNNTVVTENGKLVANKTISEPPVRDSSDKKEAIKKVNDTNTIQAIKFIEKNSTQDHTWTLVSTVAPQHLSSQNIPPPTVPYQDVINPPVHVDLVPKPMQGFGLEESTAHLNTDVFQFSQLCNELAFGFWKTVTSGLSSARSVFVSPFAAVSMLAMVFLGAKGATSEEMNEILKLDDMVTFNPHLIFKNVSESLSDESYSGIAVTTMIRELFSDRSKGKLLDFYKNRVRAFYDGYVEEVGYREIGDVIRRRTNLLIKKYTNGKYPEFLKDSSIVARPPLSGVSVNIFETDCSQTSTKGRDGELHFIILPSIRQRRLVPVPAVVYKSGFLAGYEPSLDATAVSLGTKEQIVSTILVIPGQQGIAALGDGLARLEKRLVESSFKKGAWSRLLRCLIPRPGLEVQIPRFSHRSIINTTNTLKKMGLHELFNPDSADLRGLNGVANELHLSDVLQINSFATCGESRIDGTYHSEVYPATTLRARGSRYFQGIPSSYLEEEPRDYQRAFHDPLHDPSLLALPLSMRPRQARIPEIPRLRFDRPFLYFIRHNPTGLILHMGRFNPRLLP